MKKKFLAGLTVGLMMFGVVELAEAAIYDPTADFSITNGNPNGVWSYGWMPTDFSTFHLYQTADSYWNNWSTDELGVYHLPGIWRSSTPQPVVPDVIALHPGPQGQASVLRWTTPIAGEYQISGQFFSGDLATPIVGIRENNAWLWQATDAGTFALTRTVTANETVDFVVYNDFYYGSTPLDLKITSVPEPSTIFLFSVGIVGLAGNRLKKKRGKAQ